MTRSTSVSSTGLAVARCPRCTAEPGRRLPVAQVVVERRPQLLVVAAGLDEVGSRRSRVRPERSMTCVPCRHRSWDGALVRWGRFTWTSSTTPLQSTSRRAAAAWRLRRPAVESHYVPDRRAAEQAASQRIADLDSSSSVAARTRRHRRGGAGPVWRLPASGRRGVGRRHQPAVRRRSWRRNGPAAERAPRSPAPRCSPSALPSFPRACRVSLDVAKRKGLSIVNHGAASSDRACVIAFLGDDRRCGTAS